MIKIILSLEPKVSRLIISTVSEQPTNPIKQKNQEKINKNNFQYYLANLITEKPQKFKKNTENPIQNLNKSRKDNKKNPIQNSR
ncbi:hypothetical protein HYC85_016399 [Camellia sinensis]|uniref:Uncharacterized protein n=1 Tax=Camellia sinensis TaxID=4442 RepID=A0A7J7H1U6_CAMSI|nr:hypothetical protein HYC85_016399 [Camellia sinensis]